MKMCADMNVRILATLLCSIAFFSSEKSFSEVSSAEMSCKVLDHIVISVDQGKSKRYLGYTGSYRAGDSLTLELRLSSFFDQVQLDLMLDFNGDPAIFPQICTTSKKSLEKDAGISLEPSGSGEVSCYFSKDRIRVDGLFGDFVFNRYYKTDWHGIFATEDLSEGSSESRSLTTLDCRKRLGSMDTLYEELFQLVNG